MGERDRSGWVFGEKSERESLSAKVIAGINVIKLENIFFKIFYIKTNES